MKSGTIGAKIPPKNEPEIKDKLVTASKLGIPITSFKKIQYNVLIRDIFDKSMRLILVIVFLAFGFGLGGIAFAYTIAIILTVVLLFYFLRKREFIVFDKSIKAILGKKHLLFNKLQETKGQLLLIYFS